MALAGITVERNLQIQRCTCLQLCQMAGIVCDQIPVTVDSPHNHKVSGRDHQADRFTPLLRSVHVEGGNSSHPDTAVDPLFNKQGTLWITAQVMICAHL